MNIIIKGANLQGPEVEKKVEELLGNKIQVKATITASYNISKTGEKDIILAKVQNWQQKMDIMRNKIKLRGSGIYIESDMTLQERNIQLQIRKIAREERSKQKTVKVGYEKLWINGTMYKWDKKENGVVEQSTHAASKND